MAYSFIYSVYIKNINLNIPFKDCEPGYKRFGSYCYIDVGENADAAVLKDKCNVLDAHLWTPLQVGDKEVIKEMFGYL